MAEYVDESHEASHAMACMEIWGGSRATSKTVTLPGLDAWVYSRPYQQAESGGDVYYVSSCATGRITRLLLADVSGHGSSVAATAEHLRLLMRRYVNHFQQVKFVSSMNDEFAALNQTGGFATAVVATFLAPSQKLTFSNAGHPSPLIYSSRTKTWQFLESSKDHLRSKEPSDLPLGIFEKGNYAEVQLKLNVNDLVLFYTDAFIESQNPDGTLIGPERFLELVSELKSDDPSTLLDQIVARVTELHAGNLNNDDVTLLLFRPTGEEAQVPIKKRILAPFHLAKGIAASLLSGGKGMPLPEFSLQNLTGVSWSKPPAEYQSHPIDKPR